MTREFVISDDEESIITREEIQKKIKKISLYLNKVDSRLAQIEKELEKIHLGGADTKLTELGLEAYNLKDNISKEI